jgi:hypothetical protein
MSKFIWKGITGHNNKLGNVTTGERVEIPQELEEYFLKQGLIVKQTTKKNKQEQE